MKTKLNVLLKIVFIRSATQRLKMNRFVTVCIFLFSDKQRDCNVAVKNEIHLRNTIQRTAQFPHTAVTIITLKAMFQNISSL